MEENILLMFLSPIQVDEEGKVRETEYKNIEGETTKTTNESAVRYLLQNSIGLSKIFILVSGGVQKNITYKDKNKEISSYLEDNRQITHFEFFKKRMKNFLDAENCITDETIYFYDENNSGEENLKSVAKVAELIKKYSAGKKIILHADLTGGMRHINMMMLDIIRLLEYSDIEIGRLLYSNFTTRRVEEVKNIYDLFQLISGVEEFINFGSVNALKKYYDTAAEFEISDQLKNLLEAMKNFADAINLCRYGKFTDAIKQLHDAINDFDTNSKDVQDILMARLIEKIREKYSKLIATRGEDDLKILSWCIENGYLQQTLTLYTERVPEYIYKNFVVLRKNDAETVEKILEEDNRNFGFYVLNNYKEDDENFKNARADFETEVDKLNVKYFSTLKKILQSQNFSCDEVTAKLFEGKTLPRGVKFPNKKTLQQIFESLDAINKNPKIFKTLDAQELFPLKKIIDAIKTKLEEFEHGKQRGKEILKFLQNRAKLKDYFPAYECDTKIFRLEYMLNQKIFRLKMDNEKFFGVMEKYFLFKDERNHSNHARQDETGEFETAKKLQDEMKRGLKEIETIEVIELAEIEEPEEFPPVEKIFLNHTNHSSENWSAEQKAAAEKFGRIVDFPFPEISPNFGTSEIQKVVSENLKKILKLSPTVVLCQGEFCYTFDMIERLKKHKIKVVAATSERVVEEIIEKDGTTKRRSEFKFVRFRSY